MTSALSRTRPARASAKRVSLSATAVDQSAAAGTTIGTVILPAPDWTARLADSAGGMFALDGSTLKTGSTPLVASPQPKVLIAATNGADAAAALLPVDVQKPLPSLPLAAGARVAAIGDSLIGYNNYGGAAIPSTDKGASSYGYGFVEWAAALDPRFNFDSWFDAADATGRNLSGANQGVFGDHLASDPSGGITGRLPGVLARQVQVLVIEGGTNSINSGDTGGQSVPASAAYVIARLDATLKAARTAGIPTILMTLLPRGDWPSGDPRYQTILDVNTWIRAQAGRSGVAAICDPWLTLTSGGVQDASKFMSDKVHPNPLGALLIGRDHFLPAVQAIVSAGSVFDQDPTAANLFSATQAKMQGTSGTKSGSPAPTGNVAANFAVSAGNNIASILCSKEVISGDMEAQVLDVTPTSNNAAAYGSITIGFPTIVPPTPANGKWYRAAAKIEVSGSGAIGIARMPVTIYKSGVGNVTVGTAMQSFSSDFAGSLPNSVFWLATKPLQVSTAAYDRIGISLNIYFSKVASPFRLKISRPIVRESSDPRPAWGY